MLLELVAKRLPREGRIVTAVSGGPDSVALLRLLYELRPDSLVVAHFNHRLRGADSDTDQAFVEDLARSLRLPCRVGSEDVGALPGNLEANARRRRYDFLRRTAQAEAAHLIATGHTLDDQAETVLQRVIRGTGLRGLAAIHAERELAPGLRLVRPILELRKIDCIRYLESIAQGYRLDAGNADPRFTRNRLRHDVLPILQELNPHIADVLGTLARQAAEADAVLRPLAEELLCRALVVGSRPTRLRLSPLRSAAPYLVIEALRLLWERDRRPIDGMGFAEWQNVRAVVNGERSAIDLPGALRLRVRGAFLSIEPIRPKTDAGCSVANPYIIAKEFVAPDRDDAMLRPIRRALLSVSDKSGLIDLAKTLREFDVELISTGGTRAALAEAGLPVRDISEVTGFPEILSGRVKTLHPVIHAGLLAKRDDAEHLASLRKHGLSSIDLVVCNLYPFEATIAKPGATAEEIIEKIDIGGPTMLRAAAKNHDGVAVLCDPDQYEAFRAELKEGNGSISGKTRLRLAAAAFARTAAYDSAIAAWFMPELRDFPQHLTLHFERLGDRLRYGENPHQPAAVYVEPGLQHACVASAKQLHGKELSYNNYLDLDSALNLVREFDSPAAVVIKHNNPCGAATADTLAQAFQEAYAGDPISAFGGIIAFNRPVDSATANELTEPNRFVECIIAPAFLEDAFAILTTRPTWKKNVRLLATGPLDHQCRPGLDYRRIDGGLLVQARDTGCDNPPEWRPVTQRTPTAEETAALRFAWRVCKHVKSNAVVIAVGTRIVGVGAGQMSRVDSTRIAIQKAGDRSKGAVLASDAFFPFRDNVDLAASAGITAIVQPGGSQRDAESIAACDEHGIAMLFTGMRHFRH